MASTAVVPAKKGGAVFKVDLSKFDPKKMAARAESFARAVGANGLGSTQRFPGTKYTYSKGVWYIGYGDKKKKIDEDTVVVVNALKAGANWQKWVNKKPTFASNSMFMLADGDELPTRESLGDLDEDEWDVDANDKPQDPWKPVLVFPIRDEDDETINHIELNTKSGTIAGFNLFKEVMESLPSHMGEIALVKLGTKQVEIKRKTTNKKGKEVETTFVFDAPTFEVVGWTDMRQCDDPDTPMVEASDEVGEVETRERVPEKSASKGKVAPEPEAKPSKANGKRSVKPVEPDEEEDEL